MSIRLHDRWIAFVDADVGTPNVVGWLGIDRGPTRNDILAETAVSYGAVKEADRFGNQPGDHELDQLAEAAPNRFASVIDRLAR